MTSEIRTNSLKSRAGLSTVTLTDSGPMFSGITTFVDNSTFSVGTGGTIHAPATNTLNIGVNNTESLRIDSNSNLKVAGIVTATHFYGNGANLTNLPAGNLTGTLPAISGANLTSLPAQASIANNSDNRVITGGSGVNLNGEANLTFNGGRLVAVQPDADIGLLVQNSSHNSQLRIETVAANKNSEIFFADSSDGDVGKIDYDHNDNSLSFTVNASESLRIDSAGLLGLNVTPSYSGLFGGSQKGMHIGGTTAPFLRITSSTSSQGDLILQAGNSGADVQMGNLTAGGDIVFWNKPSGGSLTERLRIKDDGQATFTGNKVKINGGTTARSIDVETTFGSGGEIASFQNNNAGNYGGLVISGGEIDRECRMEAAWGNGFFTYWTNNAERMRIDASGHTFFSQMTSLTASGSNKGINIENNSNYGRMNIHGNSSAGNALGLSFYNNGNNVGTIYYNTSSTAYNTSSDYRLKENQVSISDGITRLKSLKPYRFNFKVDPDKTVDGFFAHEVAPIIPEAVTGEKDAEDMQQMDQSKLVPLLTAALQEAIAKIETLEQDNIALRARVTNLEGN